VRSVFTGKVDLGYVQDRHTVWYDELMKSEAKVKAVDEVVRKVEVQVEAAVKNEEKDRILAAAGVGEIQREKEENAMPSTIKVKGMSCQHCVMSVTKALGQLEGIKNVQVDLAKGEVRFDNTKEVASNRIAKAIEDAGYEVVF
jgi:copper ion binding protein